MKALLETTEWPDGTPNHTYLMDGTKCVGYIKRGTTDKIMFPVPLKKFDKKGRKFKEVKI